MKWIAASDIGGITISFDLLPRAALLEFVQRSFWISGIENQRFIDEVKLQLEKAINDGTTYDEFKQNFNDLFQSYGVTPENTIRLDTIFRTNLFAAYTAGQVQQVSEVKDQFPIWRCIGVQDARSNPNHSIITNKYFRNGPYPPIWYNCRHTPQFIHITQVNSVGSQIYDSVYDLVDPTNVIDFSGNSQFETWRSANSAGMENGILNVIQSGVI
jgi:hypothetical protein